MLRIKDNLTNYQYLSISQRFVKNSANKRFEASLCHLNCLKCFCFCFNFTSFEFASIFNIYLSSPIISLQFGTQNKLKLGKWPKMTYSVFCTLQISNEKYCLDSLDFLHTKSLTVGPVLQKLGRDTSPLNLLHM